MFDSIATSVANKKMPWNSILIFCILLGIVAIVLINLLLDGIRNVIRWKITGRGAYGSTEIKKIRSLELNTNTVKNDLVNMLLMISADFTERVVNYVRIC